MIMFNWLSSMVHRISRRPARRATSQDWRTQIGWVEHFEQRITPSAGVLDPTFDTDGRVVTDFPSGVNPGLDIGRHVSLEQPDGKVVVVGDTSLAYLGSYELGLARYQMDGNLDNTFSGDGLVRESFLGVSVLNITGMALQNDGKIVVVGSAATSDYDFFVARFETNGNLDLTFGGGDGWLTEDLGSTLDFATSVAIQSDGTIVVAGYSDRGATGIDFALARFNSNGTTLLSQTFTDFGSLDDEGQSVVLDASDNIVVAGFSDQTVGTGSGYDFALARYDATGALDIGGFGTLGKVLTDFATQNDYAYSVAIQTDGMLVVAGSSDQGPLTGNDFALARYDAAGVLDAGFGVAGLVTTDFAGFTDIAFSVAIQADGMILAAGASDQGVTTGLDFALTRYENNGNLNATFGGGDGLVTTDFNSLDDLAYSVAVSPDGRIVAAGRSDQAGTLYDFAVARYLSDGSLDLAFGGDGKVLTDFNVAGFVPGLDDGRQVSITQPDGKVIVGGNSFRPFSASSELAISRYNDDGSLDISFGNGGLIRQSYNGVAIFEITGLALQADGKIVLVGSAFLTSDVANFDVFVARFNANGSVDNTFSTDGWLTTDFGSFSEGANSVAVDAAGRIVVAGYSLQAGEGSDFALARYDEFGMLDGTFGTGGKVISDLNFRDDVANAVAIQADGKIVAAGFTFQDETFLDFAVARYDDSGVLDVTFDTDGWVTTDFNNNMNGVSNEIAYGLALQADGKIIAVGYSDVNAANGFGNDFALARYDSTGALDNSFDTDGLVTTDFDSPDDVARGVVVQTNGKIVVAGLSNQQGVTATGYDFALARYVSNGILDTGFGAAATGKVTTDFLLGGDDQAFSVTLQNDGKIVAAGLSNQSDPTLSDFAVARYDGDPLVAVISGFVYVDANNNGLDGGETGIANVSLTLTGSNDLGAIAPITILTDTNGFYSFANLRPGTYSVTETQPAGYLDGLDTYDNVTVVANSNTTDTLTSIMVGSGQTDDQNNFGELQPAAITGYVYIDANNNGLDGAEAGIGNVSLTLTGSNDLGTITPITIQTAANGFYSFGNLRPGTYTVTETQPAGYLDGKDTFDNVTAVANSNTTDTLANITVTSGQTDSQNNFGELRAASITGYVYLDTNNNGLNGGETGITGVSVTLSGSNDLGTIAPTTILTGTNGYYSFGNLRPGTYNVTETQPAGYLDGKDTYDNLVAVPGSNATDTLANIAVGSGQTDDQNNFGELQPSSLRGFVYGDANNDGIKQTTESGIGGATITLTGSNDLGVIVPVTAITAADGSYSFTNLRPGTYTITETQPGGYLDGKDTIGTPGGTTTNDVFSNVVLVQNVSGVNNNFGEIRYGSLSGTVYLDINDSGVQGDTPGEVGIANVTLTLTGTDYLGNVVSKTTTTGSDGKYTFIGLIPSNSTGYKIVETQLAGYADGIDTVGTINGVLVGTVTTNDTISSIVLPASNNDGINYNFGEHGIYHGLTATIGFWHNKIGQDLIKSFGKTSSGLTLANWLATTYPNLFGKNAPGFNVKSTIGTNLTGRTNNDVAAYYLSLFATSGQKSYAQVLATSLAVFTTTNSLDTGATSRALATKYGFILSNTGTGAATYAVPTANWSAFGITSSSGATKTISQLLTIANSKTSSGKLNAGNSTLITQTNNVFDHINNAGDIL